VLNAAKAKVIKLDGFILRGELVYASSNPNLRKAPSAKRQRAKGEWRIANSE
jgi:hypothetical protein